MKSIQEYVSLQQGPFHLNELCMLVATCRRKKVFGSNVQTNMPQFYNQKPVFTLFLPTLICHEKLMTEKEAVYNGSLAINASRTRCLQCLAFDPFMALLLATWPVQI